MIHILGLDLHNVVTFKEASLDFVDGLTYIRGLNLDSDAANPTSNGAGKSLLFSTLANVLYQTTPLALKRKSKRDILRQKGSTVGIILKPSADSPEYEILQTASGYKIYEDGVDVEVRTIPIAEEYIRKLFPISETKFYSTCYLTTQRPYVLQRDTDSNRLQHLSDIFDLDQYSAVKDVLATRLRSIKDHEIKIGVLEQQRLDLVKKLESVTCELDEKTYRSVVARFDSLTRKREALKVTLFEATARKRDLSSLVGIEQRLDSLRKRYPFKKPPESQIVALKEMRSAAVAWDRWKQRFEEASNTRTRLKRKLSVMQKPDTSYENLLERLTSLNNKLTDAKSLRSQLLAEKQSYDDSVEELRQVDEALAEYAGLTLPDDVDLDSEISLCKSTLKLESLVHRLSEDCACPTCGSVLDVDGISKMVASAKKKLSKYNKYKQLEALTKQRSTLSSVAAFDETKLEDVVSTISKLSKQLSRIEEERDLASTYENLRAQLKDSKLPEKPESERPKYQRDELDDYIQLCSDILEALSAKTILLRTHQDLKDLRTVSLVERALAEVDAQIESFTDSDNMLRTTLSNLGSSISSYEHYRNTHKLYSTELSEVASRIQELSPQLADKKILEVLVKAYGPKGLRSTAVDTVCQLLQANLNHYRDLIFAEPFTFSVKSDESGVSVLVDRNNGKPDSVSDVRNLSGAESNSFQLLCMASLLPLLPSRLRVNFVILDEPTSHMCPASRAIFNERFLPFLREVVPSIFVISPHSDDVCPNSRQLTVCKQNGLSKIIE